jgi:flagellar FliJ protein
MRNLLEVKLKLEEQAKIAYGNARLKLTQEEEKLEALEKNKASYEDHMRSLRMQRLDIRKIKHCEEAIEIIKVSIKQQIITVKNAAQRLEVARIRLNDAITERKIQEKLRENALKEYMVELEAEEQKEIDERNSFKFSVPVGSEGEM